MTNEQLEAVYKLSNSIYNKEIRLVDAKKIISEKFNVNPNSFADYYRAFQKMLDGKLHSRSISSDLRNSPQQVMSACPLRVRFPVEGWTPTPRLPRFPVPRSALPVHSRATSLHAGVTHPRAHCRSRVL